MSSRRAILLTCAIACVASSCTAARQMSSDPAASDPAREDPDAPATMVELELRSHGDRMNGLLYVAAGAGAHPTVILLHGFPGNERNLDLAQAIRRAGINVLYFNYRGAWGSGGNFSFTHAREDVAAVIEKVRTDGQTGKNRTDPNRIALIGHSLGGWLSLIGAIDDPAITCAGALDYWNIGADGHLLRGDTANEAAFLTSSDWYSAPGAPLHLENRRSLLDELERQADRWNIDSLTSGLRDRPVLLLSTLTNSFHGSTLAALKKSGSSQVTSITWDTDHLFSSKRIELARTVVDWLKRSCKF